MLRFAVSVRLLTRLLLVLGLIVGLVQAAFAQGEGSQEPAHVELILDASGSMFNRLPDDRYRIVAAKEVLAELVAALPSIEQLSVGYRAYGSEKQATADGSCLDTKLFVPIDPMQGAQRQTLLDTVRNTQARGATPIAYSLELALTDLQDRNGRKLVVLITDGEEGCGGNVRAAAEALKAAGIDLRIIGFDLNEAGRRAFEGVGVFENATSAAELLAALNRAVVETAAPAPAPGAYPVTVTLLREGQPAADGPTVAFVPTLGDDAVATAFALRDQTFHADLPAGAYMARVADAHSAEPLTVGGLVVTPEGKYEFEIELAPRLAVVLTPASSTPNAGATLSVTWEGAPNVQYGYIALTLTGEDAVILYVDAPGASGEAELRLPSQVGTFDLRYQLDQPSGVTDLLGIATIELQAVDVVLEAPAEAAAGSVVNVGWHGPDSLGDFITIVAAGAPDYTWGEYAETAMGSPAEVRAPNVAGDFEIRYLDGYSNQTLAAVPLTVGELSVAFTAPAEAVAGSVIVLNVTRATTYSGDYITIVPVGTAENEWGTNYTPIDGPGQWELTVDEIAGEYLLRYQTEAECPVLATLAITIVPASASLTAPAAVGAGEYFEVSWEGAGNVGDFVTIVPAGAAEGEWGYSIDVSAGSPLELYAGDEPGAYEIRYVTGYLHLTLASVPITVR